MVRRRSAKIRLIVEESGRLVLAIKLKRTDTTLDLSQKAKRAGGKAIGSPNRSDCNSSTTGTVRFLDPRSED